MAKINVPRVAPAAVAPKVATPAVQMHGPPLSPGEVYEVPSHLTSFERDMLKKVNWKEGQPITQQMRDVAALMVQDAKTGAQTLSIDPATPAVKLTVKDISELPETEQSQILQNISEVQAANRATKPKTPVTPKPFSATQQKPLATAALPDVAKKVMGSKQLDVDLGEPERPATQAAPDINWQREEASPAAVPIDNKGMIQKTCNHCGWELSRDDIPEPGEADKLSFLASNTLGDGKPYAKEYPLMGGNLRVVFRNLTLAELDACYRQADTERQRNEVKNNFEWMEKVNRYRLCLQLQRMRSTRFDHEMPEGLNPKTNPHAADYWEIPDGTEALKAIEEVIMSTMLTNESMCRIITQACNQFNRLVNKLEVNADNPDFWPAIGTPVSQ